jgi:hypothetical protein
VAALHNPTGDQLAPIGGAIAGALLAAYYWYKFQQMSEEPSFIIRKIQSLHVSGRELAGAQGIMLALYQIFTQSVGIPQQFWIGVASCVGIAYAFAYLTYGISGLGSSAKLLIILSGWFVLFVYTVNPLKSEWNREHAPPQRSPTHTLLVRYTQDILPIKIAPGVAVYVLQINPNVQHWVWEVSNPGSKAFTWPQDLHLKKGKNGQLGDIIYRCDLTNPETTTMLDKLLTFHISFHVVDMLQIRTEKVKDGKVNVYIPAPSGDHVVVTIGHDRAETLKWHVMESR